MFDPRTLAIHPNFGGLIPKFGTVISGFGGLVRESGRAAGGGDIFSDEVLQQLIEA